MKEIKTQNLVPFKLGIAEICIHPDKFNVNVNNLVKVSKGVHGNEIIEIIDGSESMIGYDGAITRNKTVDLGVNTRDCAGVMFIDNEKIGIAHAGWRGLVKGILEKMLQKFNQEHLNIYVAPFLHSFEIQKDACYEEIRERFGENFFIQKEGKLFFNFKDAVKSVLPDHAIFDDRNLENDFSLPSNRRGSPHGFITTVSYL